MRQAVRYRRMRTPGASYFFTVNLENRILSLLTDHINALREAFRTVKHRHPFHIDAIVVLPDHLHTIWTLPENDANYPSRWRLIKAQFSSSIGKQESVSASRKNKGERGIWQRRFWEHQIRDERDMEQHIHYIHNNPVKHGYCKKPEEWPFSSHRRLG